MKKNTIYTVGFQLIICFAFILSSCKKYLDAKPDQRLTVPSTIQDLQSLLDNFFNVNQKDPSAGEISSDDYYLAYTDYSARTEDERNMYTWQYTWQGTNLFKPGTGNDWTYCYENVYRSNVVLSNIGSITRTDGDEGDWNILKGHALFLRAKSFLHLAGLFSLAYDENSSSTDLGIPLRLDPDFNKKSVRASVKQSYDQVISDLQAALLYLPIDNPLHVLRPSKPAAYALLARTFLYMRKYDQAFLYADSCLSLKNKLLDYNTLVASQTFPFASIRYTNPEDLVNFTITGPPPSLNQSRAKIDSFLYKSYDNNDLRKAIYFRTNTGATAGTYAFKGSYYGSGLLYSGISIDEVYLIRAECYARGNNKDAALSDLNELVKKRWKSTVVYSPITATDAQNALAKILIERRKELVMRGLRWMDIKRLNKEGANITLKRVLNDQVYTLPPNDLRYALTIPEDVIATSGMDQNPK
jgi:starch-binding outer membrane protein, SusD/RagB family